MTRRMTRLAALATAAALALGACAKTTPGGDGNGGDAPPRAQLTGKILSDPALANRPALAVKVENTPAARPQSGLERADVVYEELVEGGITRFIAIFHSHNAGEVGPVRSARLADPDILREYGKPLFAYSGGATYVKRYIDQSGAVVAMQYGRVPRPFRRVSFRSAPHNLYTATKRLYAAAPEGGSAPPQVFTFGELPPPPQPSPSPGESPEPVKYRKGRGVTIHFSTSTFEARWRYDRDRRLYLRSHGSSTHRTRSGKRVSARNVLVMLVQTKLSDHIDAAGNPTPDTIVTGGGKAFLLRDGVRVEGRWRRPKVGDPTRFVDKFGRRFVFARGTTWVELVPFDKEVDFR